MDVKFRPAEAEESSVLAAIIQETSGGLVDYLLTGIIPFVSPHKILTSQVLSEKSNFSYTNSIVCVDGDDIIGLILAYSWKKQVMPDMMRCYLPKNKYAAVEELMNSAEPESLFINTFWVAERHRGEGLADVLMDVAEDWAKREGFQRVSLHVWKENKRAVNFYGRNGFTVCKEMKLPDDELLPFKTGKLQMSKDL